MIRPERLAAAPSAAPKPARLKRRSRLDALIGWMIPLCAVALAVSWFMPLMTVKKLWIWEDKVSIASGLLELLENSELFLFFVILLFSIVFPLAKLAGAYVLWFHIDWYGPWAKRYASLIRALGRWSRRSPPQPTTTASPTYAPSDRCRARTSTRRRRLWP